MVTEYFDPTWIAFYTHTPKGIMLACTESDTATPGGEAILVLKIPNGSLAGAPSCSSAKMHAAIEDSSAQPLRLAPRKSPHSHEMRFRQYDPLSEYPNDDCLAVLSKPHW